MAETPDQRTRTEIDWLLAAAGWAVQDYKLAQIHVAGGVAMREFQCTPGVAVQSGIYSDGLPNSLPA